LNWSTIAQLAQVAPMPTTTAPTTQPAPQWFDFLRGPIPLIVMFLILYMFIFKPKGKAGDKRRTELLAQLKKGDRVQTIGGVLGTVVSCDDTSVLVKVDETSNTKITFARNAIHRVIEDDKPENK
jgi:preprotein translocase subunit YajC